MHHDLDIKGVDLPGYRASGYASDRGTWSFSARRDFLKRSKSWNFWRLRRQPASGVR